LAQTGGKEVKEVEEVEEGRKVKEVKEFKEGGVPILQCLVTVLKASISEISNQQLFPSTPLQPQRNL
jgi:hypothetical protein